MLAPALVLAVFAAMGLLLASLSALQRTGVPVRSSSDQAIDAALGLLALRPGERFCDLGCGTGKALRAARARCDVAALGFELDPFAFAATWLRSNRRTRVRWRDFRKADLSSVDAAFAYLMPRCLEEVAPLLQHRMRPGARLATIHFQIPGWTPVERREVGRQREPVYLYVVGRAGAP